MTADLKPGDLRFVHRALLFVFQAENIPLSKEEEDVSHSILNGHAITLIEKGAFPSVMWRVLTHLGIMWSAEEDLKKNTICASKAKPE